MTGADAFPSAGLKSVQATLTTITRRTCRRVGHTRRCSSHVRTRTLHGTRITATTFRIRSGLLSRGRQTLLVQMVDAAGNVQRTPRRVTFTVS